MTIKEKISKINTNQQTKNKNMDPTVAAIVEQIEIQKGSIQEQDINKNKKSECITRASEYYDVDPHVIEAVMKTENGKSGTMSRNSNGTYDLGPMQLNVINIPYLQNEFGNFSWKTITKNVCANIFSGTYFLSKRMKETNDFWKGVGNYHSKTPKHRDRYLSRLKPIYYSLKGKR